MDSFKTGNVALERSKILEFTIEEKNLIVMPPKCVRIFARRQASTDNLFLEKFSAVSVAARMNEKKVKEIASSFMCFFCTSICLYN